MRPVRIATGAALVGGLLAGVAALPRLATKTLRPPLRPVPGTPEDLGLSAEQIWLRSPSATSLHGWFIPTFGVTAPAVIVMHGWTANAGLMLPLAQPLRDAGFHTLFLDGRGHGLSEQDEFTGALQFSEDIEAGLGWLLADPRVTTVGVLGHSAGGSAAILAAARRPEISAVVAVSAVADPRLLRWVPLPNRTLHLYLRYLSRRTGYPLEEMVPVERIRAVTAPILLIHGERDTIVPAQHSRLLAAADPRAQLLIVSDADHGDLQSFGQAIPVAGEFLELSLGEGV